MKIQNFLIFSILSLAFTMHSEDQSISAMMEKMQRENFVIPTTLPMPTASSPRNPDIDLLQSPVFRKNLLAMAAHPWNGAQLFQMFSLLDVAFDRNASPLGQVFFTRLIAQLLLQYDRIACRLPESELQRFAVLLAELDRDQQQTVARKIDGAMRRDPFVRSQIEKLSSLGDLSPALVRKAWQLAVFYPDELTAWRMVRLARAGTAMLLYRQKHSDFPADLSMLAPPEIRTDPATGCSFYRQTHGGDFLASPLSTIPLFCLK